MKVSPKNHRVSCSVQRQFCFILEIRINGFISILQYYLCLYLWFIINSDIGVPAMCVFVCVYTYTGICVYVYT